MKYAIQKSANKMQPQGIIKHEIKNSIRLNKFISESGYTSRRNADRLIENGLVTINGNIAQIGEQVYPDDLVSVEGNHIGKVEKLVYIALNKPIGVTSTTDFNDTSNIVKFMNYGQTIFPIGRLDKDSFGLILMSNDGNLVNKILRKEYGHDKEYIVTVDKPINQDFITLMSNGVEIYNPAANARQITEPCTVKQIGKNKFSIILRQGLNRQIRRMCKALGFKVISLQRIRIMNISIGDLKPGEWRYLTLDELTKMNELINKVE